jgi:hypothetical protein
MNNVTPIDRKAGAPRMPEELATAIFEQQAHVFELGSLLKVCQHSFEHRPELVDDETAACFAGLKKLADRLYDALDPEGLWKRAADIRDADRSEARS